MLGSIRKSPEQLRALDRVAEWTRARFELAADAAILVSELACSLPGCPPLETVVAFWTGDGRRHHFKLFKRAQEVAPDDLPYRWLRDALIVPEGFDGDCC
jgi:nitrate reductase delta subunit